MLSNVFSLFSAWVRLDFVIGVVICNIFLPLYLQFGFSVVAKCIVLTKGFVAINWLPFNYIRLHTFILRI